MSDWAGRILQYHQTLSPSIQLPKGIELLDSYEGEETVQVMEAFYRKYYSDEHTRVLLLGINPGRFGAGVTGIPFTDPIRLEEECGIKNSFDKKREISSIFIYTLIHKWGSIRDFYGRFLISSLCPAGFLKDGKNYNYYDDNQLAKAVEPLVKSNIEMLLAFGGDLKRCYCLGKGKNAAYFKKINERYGFFDEIIELPHPRWVMQYRLKEMDHHVEAYISALKNA